ncbi:MAG: LamG domain-containing protein [Selenomonadaceae bacterium]|nr:LamG domain-containing protein [Selenomonadaceae bacterium]
MTNGNHAAQSKHLELLATAAKRYVLREILEVATAASSELESLSGGENILDTVPANSNGALWYELENNLPIIKCRLGDTSRIIPYRSRKPVGVPENCIVYLPFDTSVTEDYCGNTWTATGSPSIGSTNAHSENALQLPSGSYLACDSVTIGGQDFTICGWCYFNSSSGSWARVFEMPQTDASDTNILFFGRYSTGANFSLTANGARANFAGTFNQLFHFEIVYQHSASTTKCFINGVLAGTVANQSMARVARKLRLGKSSWSGDGAFIGSIDEFQIFDGVALHTENFTPE